jgi:hypothetical protein
VHKGVWRAFVMSGRETLSTSELKAFVYCLRQHRDGHVDRELCRAGVPIKKLGKLLAVEPVACRRSATARGGATSDCPYWLHGEGTPPIWEDTISA